MEAGNGDQMGQPGRAQELPIAIFQTARIAQRQCADIARGSGRNGGPDARGHVFTPGVDTFRFRLLMRPAGFAHVSGGCDALGKRVALAVESTRVAQPPRRTYLHYHFPARPGAQLHSRPRRLRVEIVVPGKLQQFAAQRFRLRTVVIDP